MKTNNIQKVIVILDENGVKAVYTYGKTILRVDEVRDAIEQKLTEIQEIKAKKELRCVEPEESLDFSSLWD